MGFTMYLILIYIVLFNIDIFVFIKGKEKKKYLAFKVITTIMIIGILVLGYLWITSPM